MANYGKYTPIRMLGPLPLHPITVQARFMMQVQL